jgi:hypothetical protein
MNMSVYERRQYLSLLLNENNKNAEAIEAQKEAMANKNTKGTRTTRVGGDQLIAKMKSGEIPNQI